jgi:hypothetical protein
MRKPMSVKTLENFGRVRLSKSFFMRDFLYSDISQIHSIPNIPDDPHLAIKAGTMLCQELLEPLQNHFGRIAIRSAYHSQEVNKFGNDNGHKCASNEAHYADHIWDKRDKDGYMGATACVVVPWFYDRHQKPGDWQKLAWWIHDYLPYSTMHFFPKLWAVNLQWHECPKRQIDSYPTPQGRLTERGRDNHEGSHAEEYVGLPAFDPSKCTPEAVRPYGGADSDAGGFAEE